MRDWHSRNFGSSFPRVPMAKVAVLPCPKRNQKMRIGAKDGSEHALANTRQMPRLTPKSVQDRQGQFSSQKFLKHVEGDSIQTRKMVLFVDSSSLARPSTKDCQDKGVFAKLQAPRERSRTVPDCACAIKSRPIMVGRIARCWIAEGFSKP